MDIQSIKIELLKYIENTDNPSILGKVMMIFQNEKEDFWNSLSIEEQEDIFSGVEELNNGENYGYEEVIKKHRK
jgi:hypothetical protein